MTRLRSWEVLARVGSGARIACQLTVALLAAGVTPLFAQEHTQSISTSAETYTVSPGGTGEPVETSVSIRNTGTTAVVNPKVVIGGKDWSSVDSILASILTPDMLDEQKARAIWSFARTNGYHYAPPTLGYDGDDPVKLFNAYGYGLCNNVMGAQAVLYERVGLPFRQRHLGAGQHSVVEVYYDNAWHVLDADRDGLYLKGDNRTIAGVDDLIADPDLVARAGPAHADLVDIYRRTRPGGWSTYGAAGHTMDLTLRPGEELTLNWQSSSARYHDDTSFNRPPPPVLADGLLTSPFTPSEPGARQWLVRDSWIRMSGEDDRDLALSPSLIGVTGELVYEVSSPYPMIGASFEGDLYRAGENDRIEIAAIPDVQSVRLNWLDLASGWYDIAGLNAEADGLVTMWDDGNWPALHPAAVGTTATLTYRMRRSGRDEPTRIGGEFFRRGVEDGLEVAISADGRLWTVVWRAASDQVGYFTHQADITNWIRLYDNFFVQFRFQSSTEGWNTGLQELMLDGIEPYEFRVVWSTESADAAGTTGHFSISEDFTDAIVPRGHPPVYRYLIRIRLYSLTGSLNAGLDQFAARTTIQVNPKSLPDLVAGPNEVKYSDETTETHQVEVTHRWEERHGPAPPSAPAAPVSPARDGSVTWDDAITFRWERSVDPNEPIFLYDVQLCDSASCVSPLSSIFDLYVHNTDVGPDGRLGTADDGPVVEAEPTWTTPFGEWLIPGETYYWRVRARDRMLQASPWSEPWPFEVAPVPPGTPAPTITLSDPLGNDPIEVTAPFVSLSGQARDGAARVASVTWRTNTGASGVADGTSTWSVANVPLHAGQNTITITATDVAGQSAREEIVFTLPRIEYLLAEGSTGSFFDLDVAVANPNDQPAPVTLEFLREDGERVVQTDVLAPMSQRTIRVDDIPGLESTAVSTIVTSTDAVPLIVERTMFWDAARYGGHSTGAVNSASTRWWFAEGFQGAFETFLLLANGNDNPASVTLSFLLDGGEVVTRDVALPPLARRTIYAGDIPELVGRAFSIEVASDAPIAAERAMYFGVNRFWDGGHASPGTTAPARRWFFAEGATGAFFNTFLLVGNPDSNAANIHVTYLLPNGEQLGKDHQIAGRSRLTLNIALEDPALVDTAVSAIVESDRPVIAERAMYWGGDWREGHDALGVSEPGLRWGVADGRVGGDMAYETFILVANPDEQRASQLSVSFLTRDGRTIRRTYEVGPKTRFTIPVSTFVTELAGQEFGATIESVNGVPIFVERATYWSTSAPWDGGSAVPATRLPD
ncbi:MAG: hypothetical protein GEV06_04095 [Luteitalea sp.]|nr:hypothetical protein [Luteitalea sp.]